jgi:hypothetical protein
MSERPNRKREEGERSARGDALDVYDRPWRARSMEVRERSTRQSHGDAGGAERAASLVTRPPRACAELEAAGLDRLVLVTGVEDDPQVARVKQLAKPACVLEDAGVAGWLEQVDFPRRRNPGVLSPFRIV